MENNGVESNTVQKAQTQCKLIQFSQNGSSDLDDSKLGR